MRIALGLVLCAGGVAWITASEGWVRMFGCMGTIFWAGKTWLVVRHRVLVRATYAARTVLWYVPWLDGGGVP